MQHPHANTHTVDAERGSLDQKGDVAHLELTGKHGRHGVDLTGFTYVPDTPEETRLVRKIDVHLLPMLWLMYILNYVSVES